MVYLWAIYYSKSVLHLLTHLILTATYKVGSINTTIPFLQMRTVEHR